MSPVNPPEAFYICANNMDSTSEVGGFAIDSITDNAIKLDSILSWKFFIFVHDAFQHHTLEISLSTKVSDLKTALETKFNVPITEQILFEEELGLRLDDDDDRCLSSYNVFQNSTIWLLAPLLKLFVKMPEVQGIIPLKIYSFKTVADVKEIIFNSMGIPLERQILVYEGKILSNEKTLKDYKLSTNSTLYGLSCSESSIDQQSMKVTVKGSFGERFEVEAVSSSTVLFIKALVESKKGFPISLQQLSYRGDSIKNWRTLADYNFIDGSILNVFTYDSPIKVYIGGETSRNPLLLKTNSLYKVNDIFDMIPDLLDNIVGEPGLFFDGTRLEGDKLLAHYNITSGALISLERFVKITVTIPTGDRVVVDLKPSYDINDVKTKIEETCGIPWELQKLTYLGDELDDEYTLEDYETHLGNFWTLKWICGAISYSFYMPSYATRSSKCK